MSEKNQATSSHTKIIEPLHAQNHTTSFFKSCDLSTKKIILPIYKKSTQPLHKNIARKKLPPPPENIGPPPNFVHLRPQNVDRQTKIKNKNKKIPTSQKNFFGPPKTNKKNSKTNKKQKKWYRCFFLHWSRDSLSPVCVFFYEDPF